MNGVSYHQAVVEFLLWMERRGCDYLMLLFHHCYINCGSFVNWHAVIEGEMETVISDRLGTIRVPQGCLREEAGDTAALLTTVKTQRQPRCPS